MILFFWSGLACCLIYTSIDHTGANNINLNVDGGDNNLGGNPLFVRHPPPGGDGQWGTLDGDYGDVRLQNGSNALDVGEVRVAEAIYEE
jgi:hypothetical protein